MSVKIVVSAHKAVPMPESDLYLPVQVNAANNVPIPGFQPDNQGENISASNSRYSELTALYWAWKNLDADAIGLVHYRRMFCTTVKQKGSTLDDVLTEAEAEALCREVEVVLPKPRNYRVQTLEQHFRGYSFAHPGDVETFRASVMRVSPEYGKAFDSVMARRRGHMCNMFIMRRDLLDAYCEWLFAVMCELDSRIESSRTRMLGYFAEHMIDIWLERNRLGYCEIGSVFLDDENEWRKRVGYGLRLMGLKEASDRFVGRQK